MNRLRRMFHRHRWVTFGITSKVDRTTHSFTIVRCWCGAYGTGPGEK